MEHDVDTLDGGVHRLHVAQLAEHDLDLGHLRVEPVERAPVVARVVAAHGPHPGAVAHEPLDEVAADEAARAGDEDGPACSDVIPDKHPTAVSPTRGRYRCRMPDWTVPLADVVVPEEDIAVVADVYRSGWLSMGPQTAALEREFAAYAGARHALAVANGTAALHLICAAAGLGPGDEVVVPSMTFVATVNAIAYTGATPVFADIVSVTEPWLDPGAVDAALTEHTKAVMTMAYGGHPGRTVALAALARERGLMLLEDAAHAAGSRVGGRHLGTFGRAGAFSFFSNKNLAVGEGGMVVTDDDEAAAQMRLLRSHGMTTLTWDRHRGHAPATTSSSSASTTASTSRGRRWPVAGWRAWTPTTRAASSSTLATETCSLASMG